MQSGRTVRLYLVDGIPTGIMTAEIMNWTGHILLAPRSRLGEVLKRDEASRTGVYLLVGDDPHQMGKQRVYIGEGDNIADRIRAHSKDDSKDFWTRCCLISSKDSNLTKAHVRYLESRIIEIFRTAERANLANGVEPGTKQLPESDIADMEYFLDQVQIVLPVVGLDFLRVTPKEAATAATQPRDGLGSTVDLYIASDPHQLVARAVESDGEVTVLAGSQATVREDLASNSYAWLRKQLIEEGRIRLSPDAKSYQFADDVVFSSPSAAAAVILNRNSNGRTEWKVSGTNKTLKQWQDAQVTRE